MQRDYNNRNRAYGDRKKRRRYRQRVRRIRRLILGISIVCMVCMGAGVIGRTKDTAVPENTENRMESKEQKRPAEILEDRECLTEVNRYPQELQEMLEKYPQTYEFVQGYPERSRYQGKEIDLSEEVQSEEVPLLLQWDKRWGYDNYGSKMIGSSGCGPTCMSMAYIYLKKDTDMNPRRMAEFAEENGYNAEAGTKWDFMTEGAEQLGLTGRKLGLDEAEIRGALDCGNVIICSMSPGDFTKGGHFILIRGYDNRGFLVNDPNSRENSEKHWEFDRISYQIKCLWSIGI